MQLSLIEFSNGLNVTTQIQRYGNELQLDYTLPAGPYCWPAFSGIERADELWRSTCLELFVGAPDTRPYLEINLSPSGHWNCYRFTSYRAGMTPADDVALLSLDNHTGGQLSARLAFLQLPDPVLLGPSAVAEREDGSLDYFALAHAEIPDFHRQELHVLVGPDHW